jgi:murein DD-endopeptidase MepM/ murein hydrolase activator NlpD
MVQVRHGRGYATSYLHLSRIKRRARRGRKIRQGQIIGLVGSTGLSTGPHLDFRIKRNGTPMNPLSARLPAGNPVPARRLREFRRLAKSRIAQLGSVPLLAGAADMASARSPQPVY